MENVEISKVFQEIADLLELKGENRFKIRAYRTAAQAVDHLPRQIVAMLKDGDNLTAIPGIGEAIAKKAEELVQTGKLTYYEKLKASLPSGVETLLEIPGVGPKIAMKLVNLEIGTADELERRINDSSIVGTSGIGKKTAQNILRGIQNLRHLDKRILLGEALPIVEEIIAALQQLDGVRNVTTAGSLRRYRETVGDIDLMGTANNPRQVINAFIALPQVKEVTAKGSTKASVILDDGLQVDLRMVEHEYFGSLLQYFTGSKQHNINLRHREQRRGLRLSEYGITDIATGKQEKFATEEAFYKRLGLQYIPPEIREGQQEIELAADGKIPSLVELTDIRGDLHIHSDWSDGHDSMEAIALTARTMGYEYIGITDHSPGMAIAHGLSPERLMQQIQEINRLNGKLSGIRIFSGVEVDVKSDGSLDLPDELLAEINVVIAAIHSGMTQNREKIMKRLLSAVENPHVDIIAHPTCRLIGEREPIALDIEALLVAVLNNNKAIEINSMPNRLDLKDIYAQRAREMGVKLVITTDAHSREQLGYMRFGVGVARRGWCQAGHILNTRTTAEILDFLKIN